MIPSVGISFKKLLFAVIGESTICTPLRFIIRNLKSSNSGGTPEEKKLIRMKMIQSKTKNMGAYLRKMAIDGYIVNTDTTPLKKQYEEMHKIGVNINQIAKKVNTTGDLYPEEMKELKEMMKELWHILRSSPLK